MTWVRLDDGTPLHMKVLRLSDGAFRLWVNCLAFSNRAVTEGIVDKALIPSLNHHGKWSKKQMVTMIAEIVSAGLLVDRGPHFEIHDYAHYQAEAMKERVERTRELARNRQEKKRLRDAQKLRDELEASRRDIERDSRSDNAVPIPIPIPSNVNSSPPLVTRAGASVDAETVRAEYLTRWSRATDRQAPLIARGPGSSVWLELSREAGDLTSLTKLLDAAFADDFVTSTGWTPAAIRGSAQRLLATGPKTKRTQARPTTAAEFAADIQQNGAESHEF